MLQLGTRPDFSWHFISARDDGLVLALGEWISLHPGTPWRALPRAFSNPPSGSRYWNRQDNTVGPASSVLGDRDIVEYAQAPLSLTIWVEQARPCVSPGLKQVLPPLLTLGDKGWT
ncbi:hypothetical protein VUR80DRAFT_8409 [Thermomyces stellatus]